MSPLPIAVSAPVRVRDRLRAAADGPVPLVHRGLHAVYADLDGWCVGVVDGLSTAVPCALRTTGTELPEVRSAHVAGGVLHLDDRPLLVGRYVDVAVPRLGIPVTSPVTSPGTTPAPMSADEVAELVGSGDGLTPYGDDLLCGWLAAHRSAGIATAEVDRAVRAQLHRTTLLSATLLDCALRGEVLPEFAAWLAALGTAAAPTHAARLAAVGHTSGLGLLRGAHRALTGLGLEIGAAA